MHKAGTPAHYLVVSAAGRPRVALPAGPRKLRLAVVRRLQPTTWKRRAFRSLVGAGVRLSFDRLLLRPSAPPLPESQGFALEDWLARMSKTLGVSDLAAGVLWPPQRERGRLYVHLLRQSGEAVGFAKVSLDQANDALLEHEAEALEQVRALALSRSRAPAVIELDSWQGHRHLVLEPVPEAARPVRVGLATYPQPWVVEYAGTPQRFEQRQVRELDWWGRFAAQVRDGDAFAHAASGAIEPGITVCRVHGDYGGHNLLRDHGPPWLLDWEHSHEHGPRRTDEVRLWLGLNQRRVLANPAGAVRRFRQWAFHNNDEQAKRDAIAALAFLHGVHIRAAGALIEHWPEDR